MNTIWLYCLYSLKVSNYIELFTLISSVCLYSVRVSTYIKLFTWISSVCPYSVLTKAPILICLSEFLYHRDGEFFSTVLSIQVKGCIGESESRAQLITNCDQNYSIGRPQRVSIVRCVIKVCQLFGVSTKCVNCWVCHQSVSIVRCVKEMCQLFGVSTKCVNCSVCQRSVSIV